MKKFLILSALTVLATACADHGSNKSKEQQDADRAEAEIEKAFNEKGHVVTKEELTGNDWCGLSDKDAPSENLSFKTDGTVKVTYFHNENGERKSQIEIDSYKVSGDGMITLSQGNETSSGRGQIATSDGTKVLRVKVTGRSNSLLFLDCGTQPLKQQNEQK